MASFYRWEKRGPTQRIPLFCVSHFPGGGWAVTQCPEPPPNAQASSTGQTPTPSRRGREHPRRPPGRSRRGRPSAQLRLLDQVCKQRRQREGAAANFREARRGGARARARAVRSTHRRRRRVRRRRGARRRARPADGDTAWCGDEGAGAGARRFGPGGSHSFSWTGINQAAQHLPPGHVLRPGPPEAASGRGSADWGGAGRSRASAAARFSPSRARVTRPGVLSRLRSKGLRSCLFFAFWFCFGFCFCLTF